MPEPMLALEGLRVQYGASVAVHGLTLDVYPGEIVGLIGPNGAGKSSTLWAITGIHPPAAGKVRMAGRQLTGKSPEGIVSCGVSLVPEGRRIFNTLTVAENLKLGAAAIRNRIQRDRELDDILTLFPVLRRYIGTPAGRLSGGEQQQLAIARALLTNPRVLLLDEPSLGLAPAMIDIVFDTLRALQARGITMLVAEQNAARTIEVSDRLYVLQGGAVRFSGNRTEVAANPDLSRLYFGYTAATD